MFPKRIPVTQITSMQKLEGKQGWSITLRKGNYEIEEKVSLRKGNWCFFHILHEDSVLRGQNILKAQESDKDVYVSHANRVKIDEEFVSKYSGFLEDISSVMAQARWKSAHIFAKSIAFIIGTIAIPYTGIIPSSLKLPFYTFGIAAGVFELVRSAIVFLKVFDIKITLEEAGVKLEGKAK